jgi:hypothetical protein
MANRQLRICGAPFVAANRCASGSENSLHLRRRVDLCSTFAETSLPRIAGKQNPHGLTTFCRNISRLRRTARMQTSNEFEKW